MIVVLILSALLFYIAYIAFIKAKQKRLSNNANKKANTHAEDMIWVDDFHLYPNRDKDQSSDYPHDFAGDNHIDSIGTDSHHSPH